MDSEHMAQMQEMRDMMERMMSMMDSMMGGDDSMMDEDMEDEVDMQTMRAMNVDMSDPRVRAVYAKEKMRMK